MGIFCIYCISCSHTGTDMFQNPQILKRTGREDFYDSLWRWTAAGEQIHLRNGCRPCSLSGMWGSFTSGKDGTGFRRSRSVSACLAGRCRRRRPAPPRRAQQHLLMTAGCRKCFCVTFDTSNKSGGYTMEAFQAEICDLFSRRQD